MKKIGRGFTLIELMIVVAIIAFLSVIAVPNFFKFLAKAKRSEAYMNLSSLYTAQKVYWAEHGEYSSKLSGEGGIGWKPDGYKGGGASERFYYTYGFGQGSEGKNFFTGKLNTSNSYMTMTKADKEGFVIAAVGDIDGDGKPDILTIDQNNTIEIFQDDLT
ncbi:prepilin-type N-terminal cleavage/methylation domain-containing protein [bacterium]|nr:prepilin-type N-terminal cleavage/methylation domain-containing protein [bacterium]